MFGVFVGDFETFYLMIKSHATLLLAAASSHTPYIYTQSSASQTKKNIRISLITFIYVYINPQARK